MTALVHPNVSSDGWFRESTALWPGQALSLKVKKILHVGRSKFQDVLVFESEAHGNVLVLDGVVQCTAYDEFAYQEMITHLPLNSHPCPKKVLVIGGGDGGVLREVVKHDCVEEVVLVEIDDMVIDVSKKYLPHMSCGFDHPKVKVNVCDGFKYLKENEVSFDIIITDSSDPVGPAESLFQESFYDLMRKALLPGGIICTQGECPFLHLPLIKNVLQNSNKIYPSVGYAYASVPTYPSGQIGFIICSNEPGKQFATPVRSVSEAEEAKLYRYYNKEVHSASFVLPQFAKLALK